MLRGQATEPLFCVSLAKTSGSGQPAPFGGRTCCTGAHTHMPHAHILHTHATATGMFAHMCHTHTRGLCKEENVRGKGHSEGFSLHLGPKPRRGK